MGPRAGLDWCGKCRPLRDSIPDRPARSESLYQLSYPRPPWSRHMKAKYKDLHDETQKHVPYIEHIKNNSAKITRGHNKITRGYNKITSGHNKMTRGHNKTTRGHNKMTRGHNKMTRVHNKITRGHNKIKQSK